MGECQQLHHDAAGNTGGIRVDQTLPGGAIGQTRIILDPAASTLAEPGLGGGHTLRMMAAAVHILSHLLIGGGASGHIGPR